MKKTEPLQEIRRMPGYQGRTFRRYTQRYQNSALEGLLDKRLLKDSTRKAPVDEVMAVVDLYSER